MDTGAVGVIGLSLEKRAPLRVALSALEGRAAENFSRPNGQ